MYPFSPASSVLLFSTESVLLVCRHGYFSHLKQTHTETFWLLLFLQHLPYILCILLQSCLYTYTWLNTITFSVKPSLTNLLKISSPLLSVTFPVLFLSIEFIFFSLFYLSIFLLFCHECKPH